MSLTRAPISHFSLQSHKLAPAVHPVSCVRLIALKLPSIHEALRLLHFRGDPDLGRREGHATQVHSASFPRRGRVKQLRERNGFPQNFPVWSLKETLRTPREGRKSALKKETLRTTSGLARTRQKWRACSEMFSSHKMPWPHARKGTKCSVEGASKNGGRRGVWV